jgi:hypothetical protein
LFANLLVFLVIILLSWNLAITSITMLTIRLMYFFYGWLLCYVLNWSIIPSIVSIQ